MKKMMAAAMAVLMLCLLTGCASKEVAPNGIMDAVGAGYEALDQSGGSIRVSNQDAADTIILVDQLSDTGTLVRPLLLVEPGVDFYKINHSEADFSGVFGYAMNLVAQMEQSEEHRDAVQLLDSEKLPEGLTTADIDFMNLGYVPDPQQRCEIIFTGMTNTGEGNPIRDEVYAFCRFGTKDESGNVTVMNVLIADQGKVYTIAQMVHQAGRLPAGVEAWMLRKLGQ